MKTPEDKQDDFPALEDERGAVRVMARFWRWACADVNRVLRFLFYVCAALVAVDLLFLLPYSWSDKHAHYSWENGIGFYAVYGFVSCVVLALVSKHVLRPVVMRDEDFYD